jgi:hypothetical protein
MTLVRAHGDEFRQCSIGGRSGAGAAQHDGFAAEVDLTAFAVGAKAASPGWVYGYTLAHFNSVDPGRKRSHFGCEFVAKNEGAIGDKGGVVSMFVVMQVSAADTHAAGTQQHHAGQQFGLTIGLDADVSRTMEDGGFHGCSSGEIW